MEHTLLLVPVQGNSPFIGVCVLLHKISNKTETHEVLVLVGHFYDKFV
jgi:hypothetical protein